MSAQKEPTRQALRGTDVSAWVESCAPEGASPQQAPRRTCAELGICQNRKEACAGCKFVQPVQPPQQPKPRTAWIFQATFSKIDLILLVVLVALAYTAVRA